MESDILVAQQSGVTTITFNRPDQRNAIGFEGWTQLQRILADVEKDDEARVVVLTGAGDKAFSAGADIKDFDLYRSDSKGSRKYSAAFDGALDALEALSKPTICLIKGYCVGGGCELTMAADIRIAADNSRFGIPVARLGLLVGYREMRRLVNLVGTGNTTYILLSGRMLGAPVTSP